jgi:D-glycero-D-manno-heptose 1,7-bisphosphate phosphatase
VRGLSESSGTAFQRSRQLAKRLPGVPAVVTNTKKAFSARIGNASEKVGTENNHRKADLVPRPAAFLDRDGTIIKDVGYLSDVDDIEFLTGAVEAIRLLNKAGFVVIVATNQSGIARGLLAETVVTATHEHMQAVLKTAGAVIDAFYYCPHLAEGSVPEYSMRCDCRKPLPGMFHRASSDHGPFASRSYMFGDRGSDIQFAAAAGLVPRLIGVADPDTAPAGVRYATLLEAVHQVLGESRCPPTRS